MHRPRRRGRGGWPGRVPWWTARGRRRRRPQMDGRHPGTSSRGTEAGLQADSPCATRLSCAAAVGEAGRGTTGAHALIEPPSRRPRRPGRGRRRRGLSIGFAEIPGGSRWNAERSRVTRTRAALDHVAVVRQPACSTAAKRRAAATPTYVSSSDQATAARSASRSYASAASPDEDAQPPCLDCGRQVRGKPRCGSCTAKQERARAAKRPNRKA